MRQHSAFGGVRDSTENATTPKSTKSRNSNSLVQIQITLKSQFKFVPRDTKESEFVELVSLGDAAFPVETVIATQNFANFSFTVLRPSQFSVRWLLRISALPLEWHGTLEQLNISQKPAPKPLHIMSSVKRWHFFIFLVLPLHFRSSDTLDQLNISQKPALRSLYIINWVQRWLFFFLATALPFEWRSQTTQYFTKAFAKDIVHTQLGTALTIFFFPTALPFEWHSQTTQYFAKARSKVTVRNQLSTA